MAAGLVPLALGTQTLGSVIRPAAFNGVVGQIYSYGTWHQMTPFIIGMADTSGAFASWIAQPLAARGADGSFFMITPDKRWPQGTSRAAQQADFALSQCNGASQVCKRYFVNRPAANDPPSSPSARKLWTRESGC